MFHLSTDIFTTKIFQLFCCLVNLQASFLNEIAGKYEIGRRNVFINIINPVNYIECTDQDALTTITCV